ncbi:MAG: hypothetical protein L0Y72_02230 [Gemmataceae bacterium]|nr:hypothetical protein [Gemmataceae bacterium]MCI0737833.1 hypothetical protein [Gemmataceae bacterium]
MLNNYLGQDVVIDMRSRFVCMGRLTLIEDQYLEVCDADLHDLYDTQTSRENYVAASVATGIKRNRKRVVLMAADVVAVARLSDVVDE